MHGKCRQCRDFINTLLSAMITMTALVVSVTMVVINLSASQLGPRIIRSVLSDFKTKLYIGFFFGSISACYVLAGILYQLNGQDLLPGLTMLYVLFACFFNLFVLLTYVHHLGHLSVADSLISKVHDNLMASIGKLPALEESSKNAKAPELPKNFTDKSETVISTSFGYIQTVNYSALKKLAEKEGLVIVVDCDAGDYIVKGQAVVKAAPKNKIDAEIRKSICGALTLGRQRTGAQDIEYSVRHLVEVGLRALSPGINDNYTAVTVLNKLSSALAELFQKELPSNTFENQDGKVLVYGHANKYQDLVFEAFSRIRNAGKDKPDILLQFLKVIERLIPLVRNKQEKQALEEQLQLVGAHIQELPENSEIKALKKTLDEVEALL